jgi:hypothetical protein
LAKRKRGASSRMLTREIVEDRALNRIIATKNKFLINGKVTDKRRTRVANIQKSLAIMKAKRIAGAYESNGNTAEISTKLLFSLGCDISDEKYDYSLLLQQTDKETVDNPNIIDEQSTKNMKNKQRDAKKNFANPNDPFYCLDDDIPQNKRNENDKRKRNSSKQIQQNKNISVLMSDIGSSNNNTNRAVNKNNNRGNNTNSPNGDQVVFSMDAGAVDANKSAQILREMPSTPLKQLT